MLTIYKNFFIAALATIFVLPAYAVFAGYDYCVNPIIIGADSYRFCDQVANKCCGCVRDPGGNCLGPDGSSCISSTAADYANCKGTPAVVTPPPAVVTPPPAVVTPATSVSTPVVGIPLKSPVQCNGTDCDLKGIISGVMNFIFMLALMICPVFIVWGGFQIATAAGSDEKVKNGREIITYAIVGLVIIAAANGFIKAIQSIL